MKILFFNLGTVKSRISDWGLEGYRSIFEQDVILWGPIPDESFIYDNKEIPIIKIFEQTPVKVLFESLPEGWFPDIVICDTSVINFIPDIYMCPAKTLLFTRDAWADTIFNRRLVEFFDILDHGIIDRALYSGYNVNILPLANCAVSQPDNDIVINEIGKRDIDVISISNYTESFYHERHKIFYKLSESNKLGLNIRYITGIKRSDINNYYQRSKIILDWSYTLSNRSFEAALNGCLLFSHEKNIIVSEFWIPWEEYIPYNDNNILELITFYLNNIVDAQKIADRANEKVRNIPSSKGTSYWNQIRTAFNKEVNITERIKRCESISQTRLHHCQATPLVYNYNYNTNYPADWKKLYFDRIDSALKEPADKESEIHPLIEAARMAFLLNETELSENYLSRLEQILPDYSWTYYMRSRISYSKNDPDKALSFALKAIEYVKTSPELLKRYVLPLVEKNNSCDERRITDYLCQASCGHNNELQVKATFHLAWEMAGDIFLLKGEISKAIDAYSEAVSNIPVPRCLYKLCRLIIEHGNIESIISLLDKGIEDYPYDSNLILCKAFNLCSIGQTQNAIQVLKAHVKALENFYGKRRIIFVKRSIKLVLFFRPLGGFILSKCIKFILGVLNR